MKKKVRIGGLSLLLRASTVGIWILLPWDR